MVIGVVGLWHLGETVAAGLVSLGHRVIGIDENKDTIEKLSRGIPPLAEPGLEELLKKYLASKTLSFVTDYTALASCEAVFITFDTPISDDDTPNLSVIYDAVGKIAPHLKKDALAVVMSQVPVGTTRKIVDILKATNPNFGGDIACVPENLQLGRALDSFLKPARIVIGADSERARKITEDIFKDIPGERLYMNTASAEMSKHALNAFLATSLSYIYNIADICEEFGADVSDVTRALKSDPRIGEGAYLDASIGFSGGTLMRDIRTLSMLAKNLKAKSSNASIIDGVIETLGSRITGVPDRIEKLIGAPLAGKKVAIFGLTYKKGTPTIRRSLSIDIMRALEKAGAIVTGYDSGASESELKQACITKAHTAYEAASGAHAVLVMTELDEFRELSFIKLKEVMSAPFVLFDARNFLKDKATDARAAGLRYIGIGRGDLNDTQR